MDELVNFFFEVGQLKRTPRSGWQQLGIKIPESVAEHTCRAVFIAYILGKLEGVNAERAALIAAFHDLPEVRIGDLHKVAQSYITDKRKIEAAVVADQLAGLPAEIKNDFTAFFGGFDTDATPEHAVAKDADYLEVILQAREYEAQGYAGAKNWWENALTCLKTAHGKQLAEKIVAADPSAWYERWKKIER